MGTCFSCTGVKATSFVELAQAGQQRVHFFAKDMHCQEKQLTGQTDQAASTVVCNRPFAHSLPFSRLALYCHVSHHSVADWHNGKQVVLHAHSRCLCQVNNSSEHCCAAGAEHEPHQAATDGTAAAQQPSTPASQKDMSSAATAASRPGQLRMSCTQILPVSAQQTGARPEAQADTRQVPSEQQELGAAAGVEVPDRQLEGGDDDAQAPHAATADVHNNDPLQQRQQQQQAQAEQPFAAEAPAGQQEGLLQGPHGPQGAHWPHKGPLQGADGPQAEQLAEQRAEQIAATAPKQEAREERPAAAASGRHASPAAEPARADAPPQGVTAGSERVAAGSAQAAAADSARASVLAALASTPGEAAAVNAAWESAAAAAALQLPTAVERTQTPTPAAPATISQPAGHRRVSSEPSATALPPRPQVRAVDAMTDEEKFVAWAGQPGLLRASGDPVSGDWGPPSREVRLFGSRLLCGLASSSELADTHQSCKLFFVEHLLACQVLLSGCVAAWQQLMFAGQLCVQLHPHMLM